MQKPVRENVCVRVRADRVVESAVAVCVENHDLVVCLEAVIYAEAKIGPAPLGCRRERGSRKSCACENGSNDK